MSRSYLRARAAFRLHSRLPCLRLLPLRRRPTSCAKLSARARLVTVAPTLSPMPNGRPLSGANGAAEFASSAIAFRRIDYWLKPGRNASARLSPRVQERERRRANVQNHSVRFLQRSAYLFTQSHCRADFLLRCHGLTTDGGWEWLVTSSMSPTTGAHAQKRRAILRVK